MLVALTCVSKAASSYYFHFVHLGEIIQVRISVHQERATRILGIGYKAGVDIRPALHVCQQRCSGCSRDGAVRLGAGSVGDHLPDHEEAGLRQQGDQVLVAVQEADARHGIRAYFLLGEPRLRTHAQTPSCMRNKISHSSTTSHFSAVDVETHGTEEKKKQQH